ncbi:MAG: phosphoglucosamine mutase [Leptonema sp. (in: Bacteria)]|nr:phosphoglucosamine mutase [Leptonema sp. (in: bacteria)]
MKIPNLFESAVLKSQLMVSVSGFRAIIPAGLDTVAITTIATAFANTTGPTVVIGRDSRPSGNAILNLFKSVLELRGKRVIDIGIAPTPTVKAVVAQTKSSAGVIITASHNPDQWNGIKFLGAGGFFYNESEINSLLTEIDTVYKTAATSGIHRKFKLIETSQQDGIKLHIDSILKQLPNLAEIRRQKFRVVVDGVGGAGREALPHLLNELGCKVIALYCDSYNKFPRPPEPTPAALKEFGKLVKLQKASVGFALDPDADRLVTGSMNLGAVHEEYTLPLSFIGKQSSLKRSGNIVVNLSTSTLIDSIAANHKVFRSKVGEANVVALMKSKNAIFGGEGNGGVIDPTIPSYGRDSLSGAAWILSGMANRQIRSVDDLLTQLPPLFMVKQKLELKAGLKPMFAKFEKRAKSLTNFKLDKTERIDGLYFRFSNSAWVHLRASNTEPILRLIAQAATKKELNELIKEFK